MQIHSDQIYYCGIYFGNITGKLVRDIGNLFWYIGNIFWNIGNLFWYI